MTERNAVKQHTEPEKLRQALALLREVQSSGYLLHAQFAKVMCACIEGMIEQLDNSVQAVAGARPGKERS